MSLSLKQLAQQQDLYIGTALDDNVLLKSPDHAKTLVREFNLATSENGMKFHNVQVARGEFSFDRSDRIVDFALQNNMAIRGHTLVWEHALPEWLEQGDWSRDDVIDILRTHIKTVVSRYRGKISAWDVVNESIDNSGQLKESFWYRHIGPEYIEMAFRWAREADPNALLFYNEYGAEGTSRKSDAVYELVKSLQDRGVPIDGVGLQMHLTLGTGLKPERVAENMARLDELGLLVHITEMDVRIREPASEADLIEQAQTYREMIEVCIAAKNCDTVVIWGVSDRYSWVPYQFNDYGSALLFDSDFNPKPAYGAVFEALQDGLREDPSTVVSILEDSVDPFDGETSLREAIAIAQNGDTVTFERSLKGGNVRLSDSLVITKDIVIDGEDHNILIEGDRFDLVKVKDTDLIVKDIRFKGGNDAFEIRTSNAQLKLINVEISGSQDDNIDVGNAAGVKVETIDTLLSNAKDEGIEVRGSHDLDLLLGKGTTITKANSDGVDIQQSKRINLTLDDATLTHNGSSGLDVVSPDADIVIYGGYIQNNGGQNIEVAHPRSSDVILYGTDGHDILTGSGVGDTLSGGKGRDTLSGGEGYDVFAFAPEGWSDVITDFEVGIDKIDVVALGIRDRSDIQTEGEMVIFNTSQGGRVRLEGVDAAQLGDSDFIWR